MKKVIIIGFVLLCNYGFSNVIADKNPNKETKKELKNEEWQTRCCTQTYSERQGDIIVTATMTDCYQAITAEQAMILACANALDYAKAKVQKILSIN